MEQLLDDNHLKSQKHQAKESSRLRVKRNYDRNSLLSHSARLHKLSKQLFQLKVIKSNNRTTAQFFSTTCYRRLKIPKRRRQFNAIRAAILFLLLLFVYLFWSHRTLFSNGDKLTEKHLNSADHKYRTASKSLDSTSYLESINLKQTEDERTDNRETDDQKESLKDLERQHLFYDTPIDRSIRRKTNNDRSSSKLDFNTQYESEQIEQATVGEISERIEFNNKEIKNEKIQNNNDHAATTSSAAASSSTLLPAHISKPIINLQFKNYSFLGKATTRTPVLVSKSNQSSSSSSSSVSSIFPVEQRKKSESILEKQLAWYELVGITMFNLLGSSLAGQNTNWENSNKKFKNHTLASTTKIQSNVETTLSKPISSSSLLNQHPVQASNHTARMNEKHSPDSNQTLSLIKNLERRLPQCIIIGVRKAGTRAVLEYLSLNDRIRKADNEVHFFDNDERYSLGLDYYRNQMPLSAQGQVTLEKYPAYFVTANVPNRIKAMNASIKLILIVRDPVIRLISDYTQLAHNKLLKLDDLMRTSGLNRQLEVQRNHLFKFPVDKQQQQQQPKKNHLEKQAPIYQITSSTTTNATNEQSAFVKEKRVQVDEHSNLVKKIEKPIADEKKKQQQHYNTAVAADYWNRIGSEPDYRKTEQLLLDNEDDEEQEDDDDFASLPIVKRQIRNSDRASRMNKITVRPLSNEDQRSHRRIVKSIDFKDSNRNSKIIDSSRARKLKANKNRNRSHLRMEKSMLGYTSTRTKRKKINKSKDRRPKANRTRARRETDDEEYRTYKLLNGDDEDSELDDEYVSVEREQIKKHHHKQLAHQSPSKQQQQQESSTTEPQTVREDDEDYHNWKIPKFEELVIRNGEEVNTNYKPVKTSIYSLYISNWLRVFHRDQIHIVDGDRLIKEPHVELNKIESFLGLPQQIHRNQFVLNKKKNFYCARVYPSGHLNSDLSVVAGNSSTSWRRKSKQSGTINKNLNKTTGRHSSIRCLNSSKGRKHPFVDKQVISKLRQFYLPFNRHFERLVGMKFNWPEI